MDEHRGDISREFVNQPASLPSTLLKTELELLLERPTPCPFTGGPFGIQWLQSSNTCTVDRRQIIFRVRLRSRPEQPGTKWHGLKSAVDP